MNTIKNRIRALLMAMVFAVMSIVSVSGCESCDGETVSMTLRTMSILGDEPYVEIYQNMLRQFTLDNPEIYLRDTTAAKSDAFKLGVTLESTYQSSSAPHIVYYYANTGIEALCSEYMVSVEEIREDYPEFAANIPKSVLDCVRAEDGKAYCIPIMGEWTALAVNNDILAQCGLVTPSDMSELQRAIDVLSGSDIIPIANSADDSAAIIEWLVAMYGAGRSVEEGLSGDKDALESAWQSALKQYEALSRRGAFAPAQITGTLSEYVSDSDIYESVLGADRDKKRPTDPMELFNAGVAAMVVVDSQSLSQITVEDYSLMAFPAPTDALYDQNGISAGFSSGFFITRKAYDDAELRDMVMKWMSFMTGEEMLNQCAAQGSLPVNENVSQYPKVMSGLVTMIQEADEYLPTYRVDEYAQNWADIQYRAAELYYGIITPEQMTELLADSTLVTEDILAQWEAAVSESDAVSGSDTAQ